VTPPPVDTIPGGNPPPIDSIPGGGNPPPIDSIPGGGNPPPIDSIPGGGNPPPVGGVNNPDSSITHDPTGKLKVYPNPVFGTFHVTFYNNKAANDLAIEMYDPRGVLTYRRQYGKLPVGQNSLPLSTYETNLKTGIYIVTLKANGKVVQSVKIIRGKY
jgi:hypothetical protein